MVRSGRRALGALMIQRPKRRQRTRPSTRVQVQLLCECGWSGCEEAVSLTLAAVEALRRTHRAFLAAGHRLTRVSETQRSAAERREDARALRSESTQLRRRARLERLSRV